MKKSALMLAAGLGLATPLAVATPVVHAATIVVTSTADSGVGSLRAAVSTANSNLGADTIQFDPSMSGTITLTTGPLVVADDVAIVGPSPYSLAIDGNGTGRVMQVVAAGSVAISGLTLQGGLAVSGDGGCLQITNTDVVLGNMSMTGCSAPAGNGGALSSTVDPLGSAALTIDERGIYMTGDIAGGDGGGVYTGSGVTFSMAEGTINSNTAGVDGGGVYSAEPLTIVGVDISNNVATTGSGGNLWVGDGAGVVIRDAILASGSAVSGGGIYIGSMSAGANGVIDRSQVSGNTSSTTGGGIQLGLVDDGVAAGTFRIRNSTIVDNVSGSFGGGLYVIDREVAGVSIEFSVIVSNEASDDASGAFIGGLGPINISHSVLWDNHRSAVAPDDLDVSDDATVTRSLLGETNLYWGGSLSLDVWSTTHVGIDPLLGVLQGNGGPTWTMKPTASSVLINGGATSLVGAPSYDARGSARRQGGRLDIGAVEWQTPSAPRNVAGSARPSGVRLSWQRPADRGDGVVLAYRIYQRRPNGTWSRVGTVAGGTGSFVVSGLVTGRLYRFKVVAVNTGGAGTRSASLTRRAG